MKPSFALNLTHDRIGLLHRTSRGWMEVGEVAVDNPDLPEALGYLRGSALGLEPGGIATKVVIPNSEVLYTTLEAPGPDAAKRKAQIRAALEGLTPYAVEDLVFDWRGTGKTVQVAVVARETLDEAESFAREHRFNPMSFVAIPEEGKFGAEPWFGMSSLAPTLLGAGEKVERDQDPIRIVARDLPAAPNAAPEPEGASLPPEPEPQSEAVAPDAVPVPTEPTAIAAASEPAAARPFAPEPAAPELVTAEPEPVMAEPAAPEPVAWEAPPLEPDADRSNPLLDAPPFVARAEPVPTPEIAPAAVPEAVTEPDLTPPAFARTSARANPVEPPADPEIAAPPPPPIAPLPGITDMRIAEPADPPARKSAAPAARPPAEATSLAPAVERLKAKLGGNSVDSAAFASRRNSDGSASGFAAPKPAVGPATGAAGRPPKLAARPTPAAPAAGRPTAATKPGAAKVNIPKSVSQLVTAPGIPLPRERKSAAAIADPAQPPQTAEAGPASRKQRTEADSMTIFGARQPQRGKPRYLGLILTGILLLFLAIIAAWSSFFLASGTSEEAVPVATAEPDTAQELPQDEVAAAEAATDSTLATSDTAAADPDVTDEMLADMQDPADFADAAAAEAGTMAAEDLAAEADGLPETTLAEEMAAAERTATDPLPEADPALPEAAPAGEMVDAAPAEPAPQAEVAAVEAEPPPEAAPPAPAAAEIEATAAEPTTTRNPTAEPQDEIYLAMVDPRLSTSDAIALSPPIVSTDPPPAAQPTPPPYGTVYKFDAQGLIIPTPEGIITPEGVLLVAGRPSKVPPERPAALDAPAPEPAVAGASEVAATAAPESAAAEPAAPAFFADPALKDARPRARPADLVPATDQQGAAEDPVLDEASDTRVTSLRPRLRPPEILARGEEEAAAQAAAASIAASAVSDAAVSPLAVAVSLKPAPRPKDFSGAVQAAVAAAIRAPEPPAVEEEPQQVAAAAPAPQPVAKPPAKPVPEPQPAPKPEPAAKPKAEKQPEVHVDELDEPDTAGSTPGTSSRSTVAKQATFKRAINLSKTNLIGVYGKSSNRYALVRQSNGRYVKVEVGDRLDGGKVAAISERELRYTKNGKTVTLSMPKG